MLDRCRHCHAPLRLGQACPCAPTRWLGNALLALACLVLVALACASARAGTPAQSLLDCVCSTAHDKPACRDRRAEDTARTTLAVRTIVANESAPLVVAAILLATVCGESGAKAHPRGHNDAGTSGGWYQFKRRGGHARAFAATHERALDVHDLAETTRWYIARLRHSRRVLADPDICGKVSDPWGVAAARVAKGVWAAPPVPAACAWGVDPEASMEAGASVPAYVCAPAVPGVQRCTPRKYGKTARRWLKAWIERSAPSESTTD